MGRPDAREWRRWWTLPDATTAVPYGQGDLVIVPAAVLVPPSDLPGPPVESPPTPMLRGSGKTRLFGASRDGEILETWALTSYTLGLILSHDCGIDQDFLRYTDWLRQTEALTEVEAVARAHRGAAPWVRVGEILPVSDLPPHQIEDARVGRVGFLPIPDLPDAPANAGPFVADLERVTSLSLRAIDRRIGVATLFAKRMAQRALCYTDAARNIEIADALVSLFN
jgi:hypothetical protein